MSDDLPKNIRDRLNKLWGADTDLDVLVDLVQANKPPANGHEQRLKANARTEKYKVELAARGEPESEDVMAAAGYLVLMGVGQGGHQIRERLVAQLVLAGFEEEFSQVAVDRLAANWEVQRKNWRLRVRHRHLKRLITYSAKNRNNTQE